MLIDDPADLAAFYGASAVPSAASQAAENQLNYDVLEVEEMLVYEALSIKGRATTGQLSARTGLSVPQIMGILVRLERYRFADQETQGWRKRPDTTG